MKPSRFALLTLICFTGLLPCEAADPLYEIELSVARQGFDKKMCWVHARAGAIPAGVNGNEHPVAVMTLQKLMLSGSDVFYALNEMRSSDGGKTWTAPKEHASFARQPFSYKGKDDLEMTVCDFTPAWHKKSGKLLGTGHTVMYENNRVMHVRPRLTPYSVYDPKTHSWSKWKTIKMPDDPKFANSGAGSVQRFDLPNGDILLPIYFKEIGAKRYSTTVLRCSFDGTELKYLEHGTELTVPIERGFPEPSITHFKGRYFLTLRNDQAGYVAVSDDGLNYSPAKKWTFDDGKPLGNYNTQQHWVSHSDALFLVYTRKGADNDHVFRHRAPLFIARVDPDKLQIIRSSEQILVPEKGARLGNFGVTRFSENETWITVTEWMQTIGPKYNDPEKLIKAGADNRVWVAKLKWKKPNIASEASPYPWIVAHRAASMECPENTIIAIRRAVQVGATAVELDVRTSSDGKLFLLHDATLDRTTDGKGTASDLTLAKLQQLDAGSHFDKAFKGEKVPSLIEAAQVCEGKIDLLLDLKEQGDEYDQKVAAVIRKHGDPARTIVGVRSVPQAKRFRRLLPEAKQLALIPAVSDIEAFAKAGVDVIRLWPKWLIENDEPVKRVRATGKGLHLNGKTGSISETVSLLAYQPDSLLSDDPRTLLESLIKIASGDLREQEIADTSKSTRVEQGKTRSEEKSFLNRDYLIKEIPDEFEGLPRYAFDGGSGARVVMKFSKPTVVFAAFEYGDKNVWSFADGNPPGKHGWQKWREKSYRGSSNLKRDNATIWYREFKAGQELSGLPAWWICLGITDLKTARKIDGFREGLTTDTPPVIRRFSHVMDAAKIRPLNIPKLDSADSIQQWQEKRRKEFIEKMIFPYHGEITITAGKTEKKEGYRQEQFQVSLDGEHLFRYFKLSSGEGKKAAIVCFMGHGKVTQILDEADSYQHACATHFAKQGYTVFAMENIGMEPGADSHLDLDRSLRLEARGWYSLLFAHQRILLDRVFSDPNVDPKRVGVAGVSTGGLLALSAAVMEPRIAAASVQGIFGSMRVSFIQDRDRHCSCGAIPGLLPEFDLPELALLVTPRALHISNGEKDGFSPAEAERSLKLIEPIYQKAGGEKPLFTVPEGGHAFAIEEATDFFREHLK